MKRFAMLSALFVLAVLGTTASRAQDPELKQVRTVPKFEIPAVAFDVATGRAKQLAGTRTVYLGAKTGFKKKATLQMKNYLPAGAANPLPPNLERSAKAMKSIRLVYGNDQEGDCVIASGFHGDGILSAHDKDSPGEVIGTTKEALSEYHRIGGPGDNGLVVDEALEDWRLNGLLIGGKRRKLEAWGQFDPADQAQVKTALIVFGGRLAFNVPAEWMNNARDGATWDIPQSYRFVGGHDVRMIGYTPTGVQIATWGLIITVTWRALADRRIFDEGAFELLADWTNADGISGSGIAIARLREDVQKIKNGETPSWEPDPDPIPPTPPTPPIPPTPGPGKKVELTIDGKVVYSATLEAPGPTLTLKDMLTATGITPAEVDTILRLIEFWKSTKNPTSANWPPPLPEYHPDASPMFPDTSCYLDSSGRLVCPIENRASRPVMGTVDRIADRILPARPVRQFLRRR